jgi:Ser/Thr protein kinase RdoA (MazF antagonist)
VAPARTLDPLANPAQAAAAGRAFGAFQAALADFTGPADGARPAAGAGPAGAGIADPIPGFLQLDYYLAELDRAVAGAGQLPESADAALEIVRHRRDLATAFAARNRLIHGDCKVDNLLFHPDRDEVLAIIDLDTVMYGHWAWDFGDLVRSAAADGTACNVARFTAVCRGFTAAAGVPADAETLLLAPRYVGLMLGVRFLADHLAGDRYFKVTAPGENLTRARRQLALVQDMERQEAALRQALRQG